MSSLWYRKKTYAHFDGPWSFEKARDYVSDPATVKRHSFFPFLCFEMKTRRFGKEPKKRSLMYAAHIDGYVFSFYAAKLYSLYEQLLSEADLSKVVLAYRAGLGNNITFAKEAFDQIETMGNCVAIGFDVLAFFDNIDHLHLKDQWKKLLRLEVLPEDHYAVFKAITKYSYVDREKCYERLNYTRREIQQCRPICDIVTFRALIKGRDGLHDSLVLTNHRPAGIPQGSSISSILANLYMFDFDRQMNGLAKELGGIYRRYSDDILWVCPVEYESVVKQAVKHSLSRLGSSLQIQDEKTTTTHFQRRNGICFLSDIREKPFQYLGFTFDGNSRRIRSQSLSNFWRKVRRGIDKAKSDARLAKKKGRDGVLFKRKLYRRFSHLGSCNFLSYARRSARIMSLDDEWKKQPVWKQLRRHWYKLEKIISS